MSSATYAMSIAGLPIHLDDDVRMNGNVKFGGSEMRTATPVVFGGVLA
jgi:hypothetical protein